MLESIGNITAGKLFAAKSYREFLLNPLASIRKNLGVGPALYCVWAALAIGLSVAAAGLSPESITRLLVIAFLFAQIAGRRLWTRIFSGFSPRLRFILLGMILAAVVEGFHMISMPVFSSLRIDRNTSFFQGLRHYAFDLLFTLPAYVVIFLVIWHFITRYHYSLWRYIVLMGLGQTLGDGGLFFFFSAPSLALFLPYPMTNYHAINIIPFLAVRGHAAPGRSVSHWGYLVVPALIGTYLGCGTVIKILGRYFGFEASQALD